MAFGGRIPIVAAERASAIEHVDDYGGATA
jgi:hypothetical protein